MYSILNFFFFIVNIENYTTCTHMVQKIKWFIEINNNSINNYRFWNFAKFFFFKLLNLYNNAIFIVFFKLFLNNWYFQFIFIIIFILYSFYLSLKSLFISICKADWRVPNTWKILLTEMHLIFSCLK